MNSNFVRVNVHNSSWRPPGKTTGKYWSIFGLCSSKLLRRSLTSYILWQLLACLPNIVVCESFETGVLQNDAAQPKIIPESSISHLPEVELEEHENRDQRQGRNLEKEHESRLLIKKQPSSKIIRWARSTTERTLRQSWAPSVPKPEHFPKPAFLLPFGRKIARDSQIHRKASTVDTIKPSNIRKRNFGATLADALDKEEDEKNVDLNDIPPPIVKFQGGKNPVPWIDDVNKQPAKKISDIKGDRTRGAIVRGIPKQSDIDWERVRVGVKRPVPEPSNFGGSGSNIGQGSENLERRGRIRIKSSFLGIYQKGQSTTRSPRTDDDVPQRPLKRDRIRNLRIRRPSTSNINSTETTSTTSNIEKPLKTTSISTTVSIPRTNVPFSTSTSFSHDSSSESIISLKGMVKEYKEIVRSTKKPQTVTSETTTTLRVTTQITTTKTTPTTVSSTTTTTSTTTSTTTRTTSTTKTTTTTTTVTTTFKPPITTTTTSTTTSTLPKTTTPPKQTRKTSIKPTTKSTYSEPIPNIDSAENTITTLSSSGLDSSTKSLKQSIQSTTSSTTASLTVTESKESSGSDIKQSKAHIQKPSLFQLDITTRNPVDVPRPRDELKKDLLEAIRRKISRNKAANSGPKFSTSYQISNRTEETNYSNIRKTYRNTPSYSQSSNLVSSTKPPFFRPISFSPRKNDAKFGNQSLPKVKIFVNIPDKKKGAVVKIPNVSHIQDKLERLNAAITEGLKLERMREEEEAAIRKDWEGRSDDSDEKPYKPRDAPFSSVIDPLEQSTEIITRSPEETYQEKFRKQYKVPKSTVLPKIKVSSVPQMTSPTTTVPTTTTKKSTTIGTTTQTAPRTQKPIVTISTPTDLPTPASKIPRRKKNQKLFSEHPSSHFRPDNWTSNDFIPMPKSNLPPKEDVQLFVVTPKYGMYTPIADRMNNTGNNGTDSESTGRTLGKESKVLEDITGTTVYVIGVIAIIPAAGLLAWFVRMVLRRKELAGSESSSETGLNRPITEDDSLQISGRGGFSLPGHCFETIAEAPENIPKSDNADMLGSVWEFPRSRLRLQTVLGEGNFGKVWKAEADDICGYDGTILVAVKTVKENSAQREVDDLIQEMKIMQEIGPHPNVVTILGVCTDQEPYLLVMEYVMYGKLLTHLREQRMRQSSFFNFSKDGGEVGETLTSKDLNKFAYGVAKGMEFLVSKGIIHRDLAARNILVDHNKNTKISDFGLSRNLRDLGGEMYEQKTKGALPIRWMAPESLYFSVFTPKSDVWGFGILMWEIVTLGSTPYPGMGAREVMRRVRDGYRLERPAHCHPDLYLIIQKCWAGDMNKRPDFSELRKELAKLLEDQHGYIDLQNIPENKYYSMDKNPDEEEKL